MFDTEKPRMLRFLTVRTGWFLGYPIIGEEPIQLVQAETPKRSGHQWRFVTIDNLTSSEWECLAAANYQHHYLLASGMSVHQDVPTEWMLLVGCPIDPQFSTMRHFKARTERGGSGIGV